MDKKTLDSILKNAYNPTLWRQVLTDVFGARNLNQKPQPIILPANGKELAENAFELGFFNTTDDRIIGLYQINLTNKLQIWRNRVGLRELLRNIYKYDVDGALVVFVQKDKWRLSFISEIRVLNDDGTIDKRATESKRYTYLLGKGEKTKTPTDRLSLLANKKIALEDIRVAFSVEALNNEFYKQISEYFYELVGATTKGKKTEIRQKIMNLPGVAADDRKTYQEFAVRLIGRTVFCWFLREKCSEQGKPLLPEKLLSSEAVRTNRNYYHGILEPLFFQTLNTPMDKRIDDLPEDCEKVPFLNGGLFEPQIEDFYNAESRTGNFQNYALKIPDSWFEGFFKKLEEYNFTIDENSPTEVEISVDPEMLGRIFENLLAEIDPDSGETARKATGSFYTPREIVNYMVDESLLIYLKSKLQAETVGYQSLKSPQATIGGNDWRVGQPHLEYALDENRWKGKTDELEKTLRRLFSYAESENPFDETDTKRLIKAIDECKILDPACGSGAFPIGVLQRLVYLLGKLDRKSQKWKQAQLDKIDSLIANAGEIDDFKIRGKVTGDLKNRRREIERDFANKELDFSRKLFLIENCIYGVDIQPIAAEISKLRCFLTLIVDDTIDENAPNRGVNPLPNLEFKFVTADALLRLPVSGLFNSDAQLAELAAVRHEYINSYGAGKEAAKLHFKRIQDEISEAQVKNFRENYDRRAFELSRWNPFGHDRVDWFDSEWMFGLKAFDIVIGNPPYGAKLEVGQIEKYKKDFQLKSTETAILFIERGHGLLKQNGIENYIVPKSFSFASNYGSTRDFVNDELTMLGDCGKAFDNVKLEACIIQIRKGIKLQSYRSVKYENDRTFSTISNIDKSIKKLFGFFPNGISVKEIETGMRILNIGQNLNSIANNSRGEMIQKFVSVKGEIPVVGGKEINKYGIRSFKGFLAKSIAISDKGRINENSVLAQNIIAHLTKPIDHIKIIACIPQNKSVIISDTINQISIFNENYSNQFIWTVLNSKLMNWYAYRFIFGKAIRTMHFDNAVTSRIPIPKISKEKQKPFENLVDYILFLKETDEAEQVNEYVPNSHLVEQFEEVIDALVYELYFEEDFRRASISFLKYAARDFPPIENLSRPDKIKIIHAAYQTLRQKDGEIRNNLKLMDIRLADLIMPIKTAR
jgi:hypothetical protein